MTLPETQDIDTLQYSLLVAAQGTVTDYTDVLTRGYLKEHPGEAMHRLNLLQEMITAVRAQAVRELAGGVWAGTDPSDPAAEHDDLVSQFAAHACDCEWCLNPGAALIAGDEKQEVVTGGLHEA